MVAYGNAKQAHCGELKQHCQGSMLMTFPTAIWSHRAYRDFLKCDMAFCVKPLSAVGHPTLHIEDCVETDLKSGDK